MNAADGFAGFKICSSTGRGPAEFGIAPAFAGFGLGSGLGVGLPQRLGPLGLAAGSWLWAGAFSSNSLSSRSKASRTCEAQK